MRPSIFGTLRQPQHWQPVAPLARAKTISKELPMRNRILALAALGVALGAPVAAQAQADVTIGRAPVVVERSPGIAVEQRPAFRDYVVEQRVPAFNVPDRVVVGTVLPETGITYYDVPQRFGTTTYRYTVVNGETVLVEPRSRRIVEVLD
jgi:Protein of unknown function (DUF1236)